MAAPEHVQVRRKPRWRRLVFWAVVLAGLGTGVVLYPYELLAFAGQRVLEAQGLAPASMRVSQLRFGRIVLEDVAIGEGPDLIIPKMEIEFGAWDLVRGRVRRVAMTEPRLVGQIGGGTLADVLSSFTFGVLDRIWTTPETGTRSGTRAFPELAVERGRIRLETPLGAVSGTFTARALSNGEGEAQLQLDRTELGSEAMRFDVAAFDARAAQTTAGRITADVLVDIPAVASPTVAFDGLRLTLTYTGGTDAGDGGIDLGVDSVRLEPETLANIYQGLPAGLTAALESDLLAPFAAVLGAALKDAAGNAAVSWRASLGRDGPVLKLVAETPLQFQSLDAAAEALQIDLSSLGNGTPLVALTTDGPWRSTLAGRLRLRGSGLPAASVSWDGEIEFDPPGALTPRPALRFLAVEPLIVEVAPWTVDGRALGVEQLTFRLQSNGANAAGTVAGELLLSGPLAPELALDSGRLRLDGELRMVGQRLSFLPGAGRCAVLQSEALLVGGMRLERSAMDICAKDDEPLVRAIFVPNGTTELQFSTRVAPGLAALDLPGEVTVRGLFPEVDLYGEYLAGVGDWRVTFGLLNGALVLPGDLGSLLDLRLTGLASGGTGGQLQLDAALDNLLLKDAREAERYRPVTFTGSVRSLPDRYAMSATALAEGQVALAALDGTLSLDARQGAVRVATPELIFAPAGLQPQAILPILRGLVVGVSGVAQGQANLAWDAEGMTSDGSLLLDGISFRTRIADITGVDAEIRLSSLVPPTTPEPQHVAIDLLDFGLELAFGEAAFSLGPERGVVLEDAQWPWSGGMLGVERTVFDFAAAEQRLALTAANISVQDVFTLLDIEGLEGTGIVGGRLPVSIRDGVVHVDDARLASTGEGGRIRFTGPVSDATRQDQGSDLMFAALQDFQYDRMEIAINGPVTGDLAVAVTLEGKNPGVLEGYPIKLNVKTEGPLSQLIREGTIGYRIPEQIRRRMDAEQPSPRQ